MDQHIHKIIVVPAVLRRDGSAAVALTIDGETTLLTAANARRLAQMLMAQADQADLHAGAQRVADAKAFDAAYGGPQGRA